MSKPKPKPSPIKSGLNRSEWLTRALDILAEKGGVLTIDEMVRRIGVSRGSFYWHFKDRADFIHQLVKHWSQPFTLSVAEDVRLMEGNAEQKLMALMDNIERNRLTRFDIAIRAWASREPEAVRIVKEVDKFRLNFVASLFKEIGFSGEELEMRTRLFVVYESLEIGLFSRITSKQKQRQLKLRHALLTQLINSH
jgi:AcrR family transcriptional regulator